MFIPNWLLSVAMAVGGTPGEPLPVVHVPITGADDPGFNPGIAGIGLEVHVGFVPGKLIYTFERLCRTGDRIEINSSSDIFPVKLLVDFSEKEDASFLFWFNFRYDTTNNRIYT